MNTFDAAKIRGVLEAGLPVPEDAFARAWHLQETAVGLEKLAKEYAAGSAKLAADLYAAGMTSPEYEAKIPIKSQYKVDIPKLKNELPLVSKNLLYVSGSNAVKLIGEHELYELALEIAGDHRVSLVEQVRIEDMRRALLAEEIGRYVFEEEKSTDVAMIFRRETV